MPLLTCPSCERSRVAEAARPGAHYRCTNCGSNGTIIIRRQKIWIPWRDFDGLDRSAARARTFAGLHWFAIQKNYKRLGWPRIKYLHLFDQWPDVTIEQTPPEQIRHFLMKWIEKQNAKRAAERRKSET
jgi:hypothetical protein